MNKIGPIVQGERRTHVWRIGIDLQRQGLELPRGNDELRVARLIHHQDKTDADIEATHRGAIEKERRRITERGRPLFEYGVAAIGTQRKELSRFPDGIRDGMRQCIQNRKADGVILTSRTQEHRAPVRLHPDRMRDPGAAVIRRVLFGPDLSII